MFDGRTFEGQRFDTEMRLLLPEEGAPVPMTGSGRPALRNTGTTGLGTVTAVGSEVTR